MNWAEGQASEWSGPKGHCNLSKWNEHTCTYSANLIVLPLSCMFFWEQGVKLSSHILEWMLPCLSSKWLILTPSNCSLHDHIKRFRKHCYVVYPVSNNGSQTPLMGQCTLLTGPPPLTVSPAIHLDQVHFPSWGSLCEVCRCTVATSLNKDRLFSRGRPTTSPASQKWMSFNRRWIYKEVNQLHRNVIKLDCGSPCFCTMSINRWWQIDM